MERIGNRYYLRRSDGHRIEVETEVRGYITIPAMPRDITFLPDGEFPQHKECRADTQAKTIEGAKALSK